MNREIKFRVWDTELKEFFEPIYEAYKGRLLDISISLSGGLLRRTLEEPCEHQSRFKDRYVLMQYTGLKDKNGKEIYEGDICTWKFGAMNGSSIISFYDGAFHLKDYPFKEHSQLQTGERIEIVGNIYENSELLK